MQHLSKINISLALLLSFLIGSLFGLSIDLGWGLPLGTSLTLVVAVLGFGVACYQSYATRKHNRLLVKPHLIMKSPFSSIDLEGYFTFSLTVKNSGLGPALIENYSISIGNDEGIFSGGLFDTIQKHAREHFKAKGKIRCGVAFLRTGDAIDKGEEKVLIEINFPKEGVPFKQARDLARGYAAIIAAKIEYRCHYGNRFQSEKLSNKKLQSVADPLTVSSTETKTDDLDAPSNLQPPGQQA